jgi:hypothetical protein
MSNLNKIIDNFNEQKKILVDSIKEELGVYFKELLDQHTFINGFSWTQYTPYFNDGDTCEFGVNELYFKTKDSEDKDDDDYDYFGGHSTYYFKNNKEQYKIVQEIAKTFSSIPEEVMKDIFGDHVKVSVDSEGKITTSKYDHE